MRRVLELVIAMNVVAALACTRSESRTAAAQQAGSVRTLVLPPIDVSTPDRALKSFWAKEDSSTSYTSRFAATFDENPDAKKLRASDRALLTGDALRASMPADPLAPQQRFAREILEVKSESDSRAVVTARVRNVTTYPPSVTPSDFAKKQREQGEVFRYVFERDSTGWKLAQIFSQDYDGSSWRPRFTPDDKDVPWLVLP